MKEHDAKQKEWFPEYEGSSYFDENDNIIFRDYPHAALILHNSQKKIASVCQGFVEKYQGVSIGPFSYRDVDSYKVRESYRQWYLEHRHELEGKVTAVLYLAEDISHLKYRNWLGVEFIPRVEIDKRLYQTSIESACEFTAELINHFSA